jgi:hypothetical protein
LKKKLTSNDKIAVYFVWCVVGCVSFWLVIIYNGGLAHRKKPGTKKTQEAQVLMMKKINCLVVLYPIGLQDHGVLSNPRVNDECRKISRKRSYVVTPTFVVIILGGQRKVMNINRIAVRHIRVISAQHHKPD